MKKKTILVVKETREGEKRVALVPSDVSRLVEIGHSIYVEEHAGTGAGFSDNDYLLAGATVRKTQPMSALFSHVDIVLRVKRPELEREQKEAQVLTPGTMMMGALDPLESGSNHIQAYHKAKVAAYSIDQLDLPIESPMNVLAPMSRLAGKLCFIDALAKAKQPVKKIALIGFGMVGQAAFAEALKLGVRVTVVLRNQEKALEVVRAGGEVVSMPKSSDAAELRSCVSKAVLDADIIITSVRSHGQSAPMLITTDMLNKMKPGAVVVDMALSEGGNVKGSEHDQTYLLGNDVIVTNVSGYPKAVPQEASILWSQAAFAIVEHFLVSGSLPLAPL